ncbi:MAG: hypothetical protein AAB364_03235 [Patescibacteria group bacterium]
MITVARTRSALLSAYDKTGVEDLAQGLTDLGWNILASSGTRKYLVEKGVESRDVADLVGEPILDHRVVTLSRKIHAGLLARNNLDDLAELKRIDAPFIDLVFVDLYPLQDEISKADRTLRSVIDKTDIGGPTLLRAAAKGRRLVLCNPNQISGILNYLRVSATVGSAEKHESLVSALVAQAEFLVADYCRASALFHQGVTGEQIREYLGSATS